MEKKNRTILLVDDDQFLLDMYSLKFSKNGYEVHTAQDAETALKIIKDGFVPDIILLDVVIPGMSGVELLSLIRKENLVKDTVVIMLTNQGMPDDIARAKKLNVDGYIIKASTVPSGVLDEVNNIYKMHKGDK